MKTPAYKPLEGTRVLVAEDDPILAYDIAQALIEAGAHIAGPTMSAKRAMELAAAEFLSCGVLDIYLRDGLVFPAAEVLKKKGAGIVFYTGQADAGRIKQEWPGAEVLSKPAPVEAVLRAVVAACSRSEKTAQSRESRP